MGLNDEDEKTRYAHHQLEVNVPFSDRWEAAREHLGRALTSQERAVLQVMSDYGLPMDPGTAGDIVKAVTESYTVVAGLDMTVLAETWDGKGMVVDRDTIQSDLLTSMRRRLWWQVGESGTLPVRSIRETITRNGDLVDIDLRVPVRRAE